MASAPPIVLSIDGLIGAGKSRYLDYLKSALPNALFVEEPVEAFTSYKTFNPLGEMSSSGFAVQYYIIQTLKKHYERLVTEIRNNDYTMIITERCFDSPLIFTDALYRNGNITTFEKELLFDIFHGMKKSTEFPETEKIFYLPIRPDRCLERVVKRNREGEIDCVNLKYLTNLQLAYESYLIPNKKPLWLASYDTDEPEALLTEFKQLIHI